MTIPCPYGIIVLHTKDAVFMRTRKRKYPECQLRVFFVLLSGLLPVKPLAYVVCCYTCCDRNYERYDVCHEFHLLPDGRSRQQIITWKHAGCQVKFSPKYSHCNCRLTNFQAGFIDGNRPLCYNDDSGTKAVPRKKRRYYYDTCRQDNRP